MTLSFSDNKSIVKKPMFTIHKRECLLSNVIIQTRLHGEIASAYDLCTARTPVAWVQLSWVRVDAELPTCDNRLIEILAQEPCATGAKFNMLKYLQGKRS